MKLFHIITAILLAGVASTENLRRVFEFGSKPRDMIKVCCFCLHVFSKQVCKKDFEFKSEEISLLGLEELGKRTATCSDLCYNKIRLNSVKTSFFPGSWWNHRSGTWLVWNFTCLIITNSLIVYRHSADSLIVYWYSAEYEKKNKKYSSRLDCDDRRW